MSHLQSIIQKCHLANPKLLELSFGCRVKYKGEIGIYQMKAKMPTGIWDLAIFDGGGKVAREGEMEILGHPITLQDVLLCLGEKFSVDGMGFFYTHEKIELGGGWLATLQQDEQLRPIQYNMQLSPYDQEESVLEFISKNI